MDVDTGVDQRDDAAPRPTRSSRENAFRPPLLLEQRVGLELAQLLASPVYYGVGVPRGDGSPVLIIPGFLGSDSYLLVLHGWLRRIGYRPYVSGLAINAGPVVELVNRMVRRTETVAAESGQPITIIGHSLGGVLGSIVGRLRPDAVAHVITLGSPMNADPRRAAHPLVAALSNVLLSSNGARTLREERLLEQDLLSRPLPDGVRLSCFFSREDAVVNWRDCIHEDPRTAAHEVRGSHSGLAFNAQVYRQLGRLLPRTA